MYTQTKKYRSDALVIQNYRKKLYEQSLGQFIAWEMGRDFQYVKNKKKYAMVKI